MWHSHPHPHPPAPEERLSRGPTLDPGGRGFAASSLGSSIRDQGWSFGGSWLLDTVGLAPAAVTKLHFFRGAALWGVWATR